MTQLLIIGAGGHGKVVADTAEAAGYSDVAFLDQSWPERTRNGRWQIIGVPGSEDARLFCAVGANDARARIFSEFDLSGSPCLVHPRATLSPSVPMGAGTLVVAGSIVNADARIGRGVILNTGCSIDHDCVLEDFVHVSPGARLAGGVSVGQRSWIGIGAVVKEGVQIGAGAVIAAGAAVIEDVEDGARVAGVPAKRI